MTPQILSRREIHGAEDQGWDSVERRLDKDSRNRASCYIERESVFSRSAIAIRIVNPFFSKTT